VLHELSVRNLGVIEELALVLGPGMTAVTGETGAGKTLIVEAVELLVGGRADPMLVRPGADEAWVEGRFTTAEGEELILARVVPAAGRSRAYVDGRMVTVGALAELGARLVDLHGQHDHQSLLKPATQRGALDSYGSIDLTPLEDARARVRQIDDALAGLGGDARARAREVDLLRFQVAELEAARLDDPAEEALLTREEEILARAEAWREAAAAAVEATAGDGGAGEAIGAALSGLRGRGEESPFAELADRLGAAAVELADIAADLRARVEAIVEDPERLAAIQARRQELRGLRRKYGEELADVIGYEAEASARLRELESYESRAASLEQDRDRATREADGAAARIAAGRRQAAGPLGQAIERHLADLGMPRARFGVEAAGPPPADEVVFGLGANPGEPILPLTKVASGGELARTMLAVRLVLTTGPETLVFDEVDAGIGGEAALSVAAALARVAAQPHRQVLVVTHLAQVAAAADAQVVVTKAEAADRTVAAASVVAGDDRVRELSRMLGGRADSNAARTHARELLAAHHDQGPAPRLSRPPRPGPGATAEPPTTARARRHR
jgi:DNA repair protein RecN (Recombination protein N)